MLKKLLSFTLIAAMVLSFAPVTARADTTTMHWKWTLKENTEYPMIGLHISPDPNSAIKTVVSENKDIVTGQLVIDGDKIGLVYQTHQAGTAALTVTISVTDQDGNVVHSTAWIITITVEKDESPLKIAIEMDPSSYDISWARIPHKATPTEMMLGFFTDLIGGDAYAGASLLKDLHDYSEDTVIVNAVNPAVIMFTVEITNENNKDVYLDSLSFDLSSAFSWREGTKESTPVSKNVYMIPANSKITKTYIIYPIYEVITKNPPPSTIGVTLNYKDTNNNPKSVTAKTTKPINISEKVMLTSEPINYSKWQQQRKHFYINCPVDVMILDSKGGLLATVSTDNHELIEIDGVIAYAVGDKKLVSIPLDRLSDFQLQFKATENGTMSIASYDITDDASAYENIAVFVDVPLVKDKTFVMEIAKDEAAKLFATTSGQRTSEVTADLILTDSKITELLISSGISSWAVPEAKSAIMRGIATEELLDGFQENTTRAEFCRAAVNLIERYYGEPISGVLQARGLQAKKFADTDDDAIAAAAALGVTSGTDAEKNLFSPDNPLTREQAATMLKRVIDVLGAEAETSSVAWTDANMISSYAVEAVGIIYSAGIMGGTSTASLVFSPKLSYTHEQSIATLNRLWDYLRK